MRKSHASPLFLFLILLTICHRLDGAALEADSTASEIERQIVAALDHFKERNRLASLSFSFFSADNGQFNYATGFADVAAKVPATPGHVYTLASVTKPITATTLLRLVQAGKVSLRDPAAKYIEGFPPGITLLDLLNHTSGFIRENENEKYLANSSYRDVVNYLPHRRRKKRHRYANINYAAIGAIIARVTGTSFAEAARDHFRAMTNGPLYFSDMPHAGAEEPFVKYYVRRRRRLIPHQPVQFGLWEPAALAQTTAPALATFLRRQLTPQFLEYLSLKATTISKRIDPDGEKSRQCYVLGFRLHYRNDRLVAVYHNGFIYGVLSSIYYFPDLDAGFAALSNTSSYPGRRLSLNRISRLVRKILEKQQARAVAAY